MTNEDRARLWPLAKVIHEARRNLAWGGVTTREPWPDLKDYRESIAYVDLALTAALAVDKSFPSWNNP